MIERLQNETFTDYKFRILVEKARGDLDVSWKEVEESLQLGIAPDTLRKGTYFLPEYDEYIKTKLNTTTENKDTQDKQEESFKYKETTEILSDGSTKSDKLIEMSEEQTKDSNFLLKAHGFDSVKWEITNARSSMWNVGSEGKTLYSSKVTVKPIKNGVDFEKLVEIMKENVEVSKLSLVEDKQGENMLVIPFFDLHFGIATLETYKPVLSKTISKINSKKWDKILIIFGQDALHNDGFTGQTTSGTIIDKVNMEKAWADLHTFYTVIFDEAIVNSNSVDAIFSNGNHDQSMGWAFGKLLEHQYPQVKFDSEMKQFKGYVWKNIFIGATHGDKGANRIFDVFLAEYGRQIANATTKEIVSGHLHHQKTIDKYGLVHKTLGSGVPSDAYHKDHGFVGAQKQFQLLEYNSDYPEAVYYI